MAFTNADNAFMAGSDNDTLYLGPAGTALSAVTALDSAIPEALTDCGWITDDGITIGFDDSVDKIRGHQGHGVVRTYMSDSSTTFQASLIEQKLRLLTDYMSGESSKSADGNEVTITAKASRQVVRMAAVADMFDVSTGKHRRYVMPIVELGERGDQEFTVGSLTVLECNLEVIGGYKLISNELGLLA